MVSGFRKHLNVVCESLGIKIWIDEEIRPGDLWDGKIKHALSEAQVFIFCVSPSFLNSRYIAQVEVVEARKKHDVGEALIIPILLKHCPFEYVEFLKELQALPKGARPITGWKPYDKGYQDAARGIGRLLEERLAKEVVA
jgi:TIR domain